MHSTGGFIIMSDEGWMSVGVSVRCRGMERMES
jgi:hypothetical protein